MYGLLQILYNFGKALCMCYSNPPEHGQPPTHDFVQGVLYTAGLF